MSDPPASVIVRARDEGRTIGPTLERLRAQTVRPEILVVDSGSRDDTLVIARRLADRVLEIAPRQFSYGRALNIGAAAAAAPFHFALSAHCQPARDDWVERALAHYARTDVAAVCGDTGLPDGSALRTVFHQDAAVARSHPRWGLSNHASSWRASVWEQFRFDEELEGGEDKEWAWRVLHAGWVIAVDPALWVDLSHRWRSGARDYFRRERREARALAAFAPLPPYGARETIREWWSDAGGRRRSAMVHRFLNVRRLAGLAGKYVGHRDALRSGHRAAR